MLNVAPERLRKQLIGNSEPLFLPLGDVDLEEAAAA